MNVHASVGALIQFNSSLLCERAESCDRKFRVSLDFRFMSRTDCIEFSPRIAMAVYATGILAHQCCVDRSMKCDTYTL